VAIQAIYAHHVTTGLGSFEEVPPGVEEMRTRWRAVAATGLPYLVAAMDDGAVAGFSYARPYRERAAYRHTVEDSVYVSPEHLRRGVGSGLLGALIEACEALPLHRMVAVIGDRANHASIELHRRHGFAVAGVLDEVGHKFGRWVDIVIMQRPLRGRWPPDPAAG
jgi:L-amino acid N-acyltransferase YncA